MAGKTFTDQLGYEVTINFPPKKIVSLVPSLTELLFDLGLDDEVVGITYFCIYPEDQFKAKTKIGGTKKVKLDAVKALEPDLVIANKEENEKEQVDALKEHFPVWVSYVYDIPSALDMIRTVGELINKTSEADNLAGEIERKFQHLREAGSVKTLYFIWRKPYMAAGGDTFIHHIMGKAGFNNLLKDRKRYPELSIVEVKQLNPELILLSSEPYPFKERHIDELKAIVPDAEIRLVDGSMFSWYGSRMLKAADYLSALTC